MFASQPWVLRHHVEYYLSSVWETTGRTSADMHQVGNRYPLVYLDAAGGRTILAGHHRSAAALLEGRPVLARIALGEGAELPHDCPPTPGVAVVPRVRTSIGACPVPPEAAARAVVAGSTVEVPDEFAADDVLTALGLSADERADRLRFGRPAPVSQPRRPGVVLASAHVPRVC